MSGFIAIINTDGTPVSNNLIEKLTASLGFRGPDKQQVWVDGTVGLGHTLFRTTDESNFENQPATLEGNVWIVGCIRIDARKDLLQKLGMATKIKLEQTPDSELVLHAYRRWGEKCLGYLIGDFSFVLWDIQSKKLICARDQFGMRQLYYAHTGNHFIISNSLHCLLQHPSITTRLDDRAMGGFLLFGDHTWLNKSWTAYADVTSLPPAHYLEFHNNRKTVRRYWNIPENIPKINYRNENDYIDHFLEIFKQTINDRLRTDHVTISMSGGIDSTAIAAMLHEIKKDGGRDLHLSAVTIFYNDLYKCRERHYANLAALRLRLQTHFIDGDQFSFLSQSIPTTRPLEISQPGLWLHTLRKISTLGNINITGAAADNLLSYPSGFRSLKSKNPYTMLLMILRLKRRYGKLPSLGTGLLGKIKMGWNGHDGSSVSAYPYPSWISHDFEKKMCLKEQWEEEWDFRQQSPTFRSRSSLLRDSLLHPDWNLDDVLMTSNFTLAEQRDPYLDIRMVNFVLSLPPFPWLFDKHILRKAMETKLPVEVINRPKTPLGMPDNLALKLRETKGVDNRVTHPDLLQFVERSKLPKLCDGTGDSASTYVDLRPTHLNRWLHDSIR